LDQPEKPGLSAASKAPVFRSSRARRWRGRSLFSTLLCLFAWQPGGTIGGTITGNPAEILSAASLNVNVTNNKTLKMRYKNSSPGISVYIYYMTGDDTGFSGSKIAVFHPAANSGFTEYTLTMPANFTGALTRLRLDAPGGSGSFSIDYLRIGNQPATSTPTITPTPTRTLTPTVTPTGPTPTATARPAFTTNVSAAFVYDGDGKMVKSVIDGVTTIFVSAAYQVKNPTGDTIVTKYYEGGAFRVGGTLYYLLSDHLGSSSITVSDNGTKLAEMRYTAWGEVRYQSGSLPTDRTYTGQRSYMSDFGLMYYNARWYDTSLAHFAQADTMIPGGVQGYDRYAYVNNNPVIHTDPTGHLTDCSVLPDGAKASCEAANKQEQQNNTPPNNSSTPPNTTSDPSELVKHNTSHNAGPNQDQPHWCRGEDEWIDCTLSGVGFVATALDSIFLEVPVVSVPAFVVDVVVTIGSFVRTEGAHNAGKISDTREWLLNGTSILGLIPAWPGIGASLINTLMTVTDIPN
jgi:RHS repeat-associated protein